MCVLDIVINVLDVLWMSTKLLKMFSRLLYCFLALLCCYFIVETIAHARDGQDKLRTCEDRFDFLAQLRDIDMQAMSPDLRLGPPDLTQQHLACENLATVGDEDLEEIVFGGCQGDLLTVNMNGTHGKIDGERACFKLWLGATWWLDHATQNNTHASQHLLYAKGLGDVVVGSQVEDFDLVAFSVFNRQDDNGYIGHYPHTPTHFQAAHAWQQEVKQQ